MILLSSDVDRKKLEQIKSEERVLRHAKYSKGIVVKPWGYEYLWFEVCNSAGWVLWLGPSDNTSMHCHEKKATALIVISGNPEISGFEFSIRPKIGEVIYIGPGCFHRTQNLSPESPLCVVEIETPIDKEDLFRSSDGYGRSHSKYESIESWGDDPRGLNKYRRVEFLNEERFVPSSSALSSGCLSEEQDIQYAISYQKNELRHEPAQSLSVNLDAVMRQCKAIVGAAHSAIFKQDDVIIRWRCRTDQK